MNKEDVTHLKIHMKNGKVLDSYVSDDLLEVSLHEPLRSGIGIIFLPNYYIRPESVDYVEVVLSHEDETEAKNDLLRMLEEIYLECY